MCDSAGGIPGFRPSTPPPTNGLFSQSGTGLGHWAAQSHERPTSGDLGRHPSIQTSPQLSPLSHELCNRTSVTPEGEDRRSSQRGLQRRAGDSSRGGRVGKGTPENRGLRQVPHLAQWQLCPNSPRRLCCQGRGGPGTSQKTPMLGTGEEEGVSESVGSPRLGVVPRG